MPEGDTIYRTATVLRRALAGHVVTGFELVAPKVSTAAARRQIVGGTVRSVESNGKHLLITFSTDGEDVVLHTHMKMTGQWHVYRPDQRWWFAPSKARVVIRTAQYVAPCEAPPIVELFAARELPMHRVLSTLGPDLLADDFDIEKGIRRLRSDPERDIATALLDQATLSGIGNEYKNEVLFLSRVWPWTKVRDLEDATMRRILETARDLMRRNRDGGPRRTRFGANPRERVWVQERTGRPCYRCGTAIDRGHHPNEFRTTWYCPRCQVEGAPRPKLPA